MLAAGRARERLLDGFLRRLAGARDADAYALRGGMLVRRWLPQARRVVRDLDLACALPYRARDLRSRIEDVLRRDVGDGVVFETERVRVDAVRGAHPMLVVYVAGRADGELAEIKVDLAFGVDVWPAAARGADGVWTCGHDMVVATKLAVIGELGPREWRPKDLADIWVALRRFSSAGVHAASERRGGDAVAVVAAPWWRDPHAAMRWGRHVARQPGVPADLDAILGEVRDQLRTA
jgi:hypothetical protein